MKMTDILKVFLEPHWSQKDKEDAARGFAIAGCDDEAPMEMKAFLEIHRDNYLNGHINLRDYIDLVMYEVRTYWNK